MQKERDSIRLWKAGAGQVCVKPVLRVFVLNFLAFFVALNVLLPSFNGVVVAREKQTVNQFFDTYDRERDYQPATEPIITPLPGFGGNMGGAGGNGSGGTAGGYYNEQGKWIGEGNVNELERFNLEEFEREEAVKAAKKAGKPVPTAKPKGIQKVTQPVGNWFSNAWNSATTFLQEKVVKPVVSTVKKATGAVVSGVKKATQSVAVNVNQIAMNVTKSVQDFVTSSISNVINFFTPIAYSIQNFSSNQINSFNSGVDTFIGGIQSEIARYQAIGQVEDKYSIDLRDGKESKWTEVELDWVDETLSKVPKEFYTTEGLFAENPLNGIIREESVVNDGANTCGVYSGLEFKSYFSNNLTNLYKTISVYDNATNCISNTSLPPNVKTNEKLSFQITLAHELTHSYVSTHPEVFEDYKNTFWEEKDILMYKYKDDKIVGVVPVKKWVPINDKDKAVSDYGGPIREIEVEGNAKVDKVTYSEPIGNPEEDFSELVGIYLFEEKYVENQAPEKVQFIKNRVLN